jgi:hypothetical protein
MWPAQLPGGTTLRLEITKSRPITMAMAPAVYRTKVPMASAKRPSTLR